MTTGRKRAGTMSVSLRAMKFMTQRKTFTGRVRQRRTKRSVRAIDLVARGLITVGGVGTIVAVTTVCLFLLWVVLPLFLPARVEEAARFELPAGTQPLLMEVDEYGLLAGSLHSDGTWRVVRADNGETITESQLFERNPPTAFAKVADKPDVVLGFADGSLRLASLQSTSKFLVGEEITEPLAKLVPGELLVHDAGVAQKTEQGPIRWQKLDLAVAEPPLEGVSGSKILLVDEAVSGDSRIVATLAADGQVRVHSLRASKNLLTDETTFAVDQTVPVALPASAATPPKFLKLSGRGDQLFLAWEDGRVRRVSLADTSRPDFAEEFDLVDATGSTLERLELLLGGTTLIAADSRGNLTGSFLVNQPAEEAVGAVNDGRRLVTAHTLPGPGAAVTAVGMSSRSRMLAAGYADGSARVFYVPSDSVVAKWTVSAGRPVEYLRIAQKEDALFAVADGSFATFRFEPRHPEAGFRSLFRPIWYEGYEKPEYVWQSSGGSEDLEPKLSLVPLIFGTLKATFYCMLFGVPIAMLAAIYTSEFLHKRTRARIKPTIELMASLPSVVLGFLAALVFAPFVKDAVPEILTAIVTVPLALLTGAYLWQLFPYSLSARLVRFRFLAICSAVPIGVYAAFQLGPWVENWLFAGDVFRWLAGQDGTGTGAWMILLLPLSAIASGLFMSRTVTPWLVRTQGGQSRSAIARYDFLKFVIGVVCTFTIALAASSLLTLVGIDPRGSFVATYDQRNALIVGFVMGFAVIPLIYTLADDALMSVPEQLRAASLGAGATPWQTTIRIVIPTATSGLFSAVMVGLGRAVGETMIVLMAGGNIPVMDTNMFSGFRTLSANIAVELAEAVRNSTHYRTLFLAALSLFVLTFIVNTAAEIVRIRFRRRVYQL